MITFLYIVATIAVAPYVVLVFLFAAAVAEAAVDAKW